ncbi:hypothetical protein VZT92_004816 [Zoarces viviparus]|uniref:Uncharacterized protein n=1 Tax=Zoarces viviparus TaxID=48416 RepID=A0AAW1FSI6_ZOAVI
MVFGWTLNGLWMVSGWSEQSLDGLWTVSEWSLDGLNSLWMVSGGLRSHRGLRGADVSLRLDLVELL